MTSMVSEPSDVVVWEAFEPKRARTLFSPLKGLMLLTRPRRETAFSSRMAQMRALTGCAKVRFVSSTVPFVKLVLFLPFVV